MSDMKIIKDETWLGWHESCIADAAKMLGKDNLTVDEKRIAYFAFRDAIERCNAEIVTSNRSGRLE